ncbi:MAG: sigma-70 family RNA polymerase sigma factor [Gemmatimonadetes bacterium]|nr:sigma-70 family RNA polymerase sigma factor [Gemmatimonadota bacterium]
MKPPASASAYPSTDPDEANADAGLVARMRDRDEAALGALYDRWSGRVRAVALRIVRDGAEAEDVVEDVFWQAWRQADRFDATRGGVGTWLVTLARSRSLDRLRALKRAGESVSLDDPEGRAAHDQLSTGDVDPFAFAEQGERALRVSQAMAQLSAPQREAIELAYWGGLSQTEIAERLSTPLGTIKTRMRLGLLKLREALGGVGGSA